MTERAKLIERLENATEPDRRIDSAIDALLRVGTSKLEPWVWNNFPVWRECPIEGACQVIHDDGHGGPYWQSRPFTGSLDAAVALVARHGLEWLRRSPHVMSVHWPLTEEQEARKEWGRHFEAVGVTPAIALCLALLKALEARDG